MKVINILIFCIWAALITVLLYNNYTGVPLEKQKIIKKAFSKKTYQYDIYNGTKKIGHEKTTFEMAGDEIIITDKKYIKVLKNGKETMLTEEVSLLTDRDYTIKSANYSSVFLGEEGIKASGSVEENEIIFFLESAKHRKTHKVQINKDNFYHFLTLAPMLHQKIYVPNQPFKVSILNLGLLSINDTKVVLEEIIPVKIGINILNLYKFRIGDSIFWLNENGALIKKEYPSGAIFYSQLEAIAEEFDDRMLFDYTSLPVFRSNKLMTNTQNLNLLRIRIKGYNFQSKLYENSLAMLKDDILTIRTEDAEELKKKKSIFPYKGKELSEYVRSDSWVLADYEPLANTGRIYAEANKYDAFRFTEYLNSYLHILIKTMPIFILRNSRDIHKSLYGDNIERTVMFATYSRAAGLPTRLVGGLVYLNGYFYFHTWPEVWIDKWISVDPTLAQFPADVTHIPLKGGTLEDIVSIIDDLRSVKIEILEAS